MSKFKAFWLLGFGAVLAIFMVQNWYYPDPPVHFLGFRFLPLPLPIIILGFFVLGFLAGWLMKTLVAKTPQPEVPPGPPPDN